MKHPERWLWAKTDRLTGKMHPLWAHLVDAGHVSLALWRYALPLRLKQDFSTTLGVDQEAAGKLLAWWISLHDLGKASMAFQWKHPPARANLLQAQFPFTRESTIVSTPHGLITGWALIHEGLLVGTDDDVAEALARTLSGHHGSWPDSETFNQSSSKAALGSSNWKQARKAICQELTKLINPPASFSFPPEGTERNVFLTLFSGLVSIADWLASMQEYFPAIGFDVDIKKYIKTSQNNAIRVISEQGWLLWNEPNLKAPFPFKQAFPLLSDPKPVQQSVFTAAFKSELPAMAILEAPTGIGKTETALLLADHWLNRCSGRGLYIAMPTQATSNQMYGRALAFLQNRHPNKGVHVHLVHGNALIDEKFEKTIVDSIDDNSSSSAVAAGWFLPRKRTLLAPYGIGTVDQVFLSVLQTRHFFVRLFGLYGKVIIFDEIHAYSAYQSELFVRLLGWLRALNVSVILLSATLPTHVRQKFACAYGGRPPSLRQETSYPRLTLVTPGGCNIHPLPEPPSRPVDLTWIQPTPQAVVDCLRGALQNGGCAAVICNTVAHAQAVYRAIDEAKIAPGFTRLFHARFPYGWRKQTEEEILQAFGPNGCRPFRSVTVATQVIEQSLDLDFDLLISELAPVDLIIQRAGRLHRHTQPARPAPLASPRLVLMETALSPEGDPDFGPSEFVYRQFHLLRTLDVLKLRTSLMLPQETPTLIEQVYGEDAAVADGISSARLAKAKTDMDNRIQTSIHQARRRLILPPERDDLLTRRQSELEDDEAPGVHLDFQALTREAAPGISIVCLHRQSTGDIALDPQDPTQIIHLDTAPAREKIKPLLMQSVQIQRPELVRYFSQLPLYSAWKECAALRYHHPVIFTDGSARLCGTPFTLKLSRKMGLSIEKEA